MCNSGIFGLEFENNIVMFENSTFEFAPKRKILRKKQNGLNLGPKMT